MKDTQADRSGSFISFIAYLQVIGIILVVLGHSFHEYNINEGKDLLLYRMCYSFRMPLFLFVSGFLMIYTAGLKDRPYVSFAKNKLNRLMLPYFVLLLITFVPRAMLSEIADEPIDLNFDTFLRSFVDPKLLTIPYFWFIQVSIVLMLISYAVYDLLHRRLRYSIRIYHTVMAIAAVAILLLPMSVPSAFSLNRAASMGIYFILGGIYCSYHRSIDGFVWKVFRNPFLQFTFFAALWAWLFFITEKTEYSPLCSTAGIFMCVTVAQMLVKYDIHILDHLIGANYIIFLLSWYVNVATQQVLHHFTDFPWWVYTMLSLTLGIYLPYLFYRWLMNHGDKRLSVVICRLLGQRKPVSAKR